MIQGINIFSSTTNGTGASFSDLNVGGAFQAVITGTGAVACTVNIQASIDSANWINLGSITLSGTTTATDGFASLGGWVFYRATVTGATGTISNISVLMSVES